MSTDVAKKEESGVKKFEEGTKDAVIAKIEAQIEAGDLAIPDNYAWKNAVQSGWLHLMEVVDRNQKPALEVCTKASVAEAFLDMIQQGMNVTKKQGYFVVYGNKLKFDPSYFGAITIAKRDADLKEVHAVPVYKKDDFAYEIDLTTGRKKVTKHTQKLENVVPSELTGVYAVLTFNDGTYDTEIMTMEQVRTSWSMGGSKGSSPAHKNFPERMAGKTAINRALTILNASSNDESLMQDDDVVTANVKNQITQRANKTPLGMTEDTTYEEVPAEVPAEAPAPAMQPSQEFDKAEKAAPAKKGVTEEIQF